MKIVTIIGARPQFVKAAVVSRALLTLGGVEEVIVHTGQHYDPMMTDVFFSELDIPRPAHHLEIGSASHGAQTGRMLEAVETILQQERPDRVLVYGDTNSTLAGALAATKLHIPVAHVEAGLRSFNRKMPEEINRVITDHISDLLFTPTPRGTQNLISDGIDEMKIKEVGDVMFDAALFYSKRNAERPLQGTGTDAPYALATVHRAENTDDTERLEIILAALSKLSDRMRVVMPLHPRTRKVLDQKNMMTRYSDKISFIEPLGYLDMVAREQSAALILTDSGGVQKEAYFFKTPCVTLRDETEWTELVEMGWNRLAPPLSLKAVMSAIDEALSLDIDELEGHEHTPPYGDGTAGEKIAKILVEQAALES